MASEDAPQVGDADGPSLEIVSPVQDDVVSVGEVLKVKVKGVLYMYTPEYEFPCLSMYIICAATVTGVLFMLRKTSVLNVLICAFGGK